MGVFERLVEQETHRCFWPQFLGLKPGSPGIPRVEKGKRALNIAYKGICRLGKTGSPQRRPPRQRTVWASGAPALGITVRPSLPLAARQTG